MDKFLNTLTTWVVITLLVITVAKATETEETSNLLNNGSFDTRTEGWELEGNVSYDGNAYSSKGIDKSVRFKGANGGSISQTIHLGNINSDKRLIDKVNGSVVSYGCITRAGCGVAKQETQII